MNDDKKRRWDVIIAIAAPILTVLGILVGVWQFTEQREADREARAAEAAEEFRRKLFLDRLAAYQKVADLTGVIVASEPGVERDKAIRDFTAVYWGTMILAGENSEVERAMIAFNNELHDIKTGWRDEPERLKVRAQELMRACRRSIEADRPSLETSGAAS